MKIMTTMTSSDTFEKQASFDNLLTHIDPFLDVEVFNRFMLRPILPEKIEQQIVKEKQ
jgi:hypothetical protein